MARSQRVDQMDAILRQADASLEKWFSGAKTRGAGILRQRVDGLQAGLRKLSTGLQQVERQRAAAPEVKPEGTSKETVGKRRSRPAAARKPAAGRKRKKAA